MKNYFSKEEDKAWQLIRDDLIRLKTASSREQKLTYKSKKNLTTAKKLFEKIAKKHPDNWPSMWALGKIHERFDNSFEALEWFSKAYRVNPHNFRVARDAGLTALNFGLGKNAIVFLKSALHTNPHDHILQTDLALAYLINGQLAEAEKTLLETTKDSSKINTIKTVITEVKNGDRPYPKTLTELALQQ